MKKIGVIALVFSLVFVACSSNKGNKIISSAEMWKQIQELEAMANNPKGNNYKALSDSLLNFYQKYDSLFYKEQDKKRIKHCIFEAGRLAMNLKKSGLAIKYFEKFRNNFRLDTRSSTALFLEAFIYENQLNQLGKAKQTYQEFIEEYPKNELVKDAKISIQNLGKSPEELLKEFEAKDSTKKANS